MRVSQTELAQIAAEGRCEDRVRFPGGGELAYGIEVVPEGALSAEHTGGRITLRVPRAAAERWADPGEVSISGAQALEDGERLRLLLEKDFECLAPREGEDDSDLFPNPLADT